MSGCARFGHEVKVDMRGVCACARGCLSADERTCNSGIEAERRAGKRKTAGEGERGGKERKIKRERKRQMKWGWRAQAREPGSDTCHMRRSMHASARARGW